MSKIPHRIQQIYVGLVVVGLAFCFLNCTDWGSVAGFVSGHIFDEVSSAGRDVPNVCSDFWRSEK